MWVDTHCHLPMLTAAPLDEILQRSDLAAVKRLVTVGTEPKDWESSRQIAEKTSQVYFTLGLHPHAAGEWANVKDSLFAYFSKGSPKKCVAIGETGLDYFYENSDRESQKVCFTEQLELAKRTQLPVIIHCRDAYDDLFQILEKHGLPKPGGIMHCFTGTQPVAERAVELGLMISFSGILTFKNAETIREAAAWVPDTHVLLETDCPYLAPVPERGRPNEPAFLPHTAKVLARVRKQNESTLATLTTENAKRLFNIP